MALASQPDAGPLAGAAPPAPPKGYSPDDLARKANQKEGELDSLTKAYGEEINTIHDYNTEAHKEYDAERAHAGQPPTLQPIPQPTTKITSPQEMWSSAAMVFAAIGSLFTRTPMTTAMNAAAATLNAYHKGDMEQANQAYKSWEVANKNALEVANFQQRAYDEIMREVDRREGRTDAEAKAAEAEATETFKAYAQSFRDERMYDQAVTNGYQGAARQALGYRNSITAMERSAPQIDMWHQSNMAMNAWVKANPPPGPDASPQAKADYEEKRIKEMGRIHAEMKGPEVPQAAVEHLEATARNTLSKGPFGTQYTADKQNEGALEAALAGKRVPDIIDQATALDRHIRQQTGNRAIRGFQLQLMTKDAGLMNDINMKLKNALHGGMLSEEMIREIRRISRDVSAVDESLYADQITRQQWTAHNSPGLNPYNVVPPDFNPPATQPDGTPWPQPDARHVAALRSLNNSSAWVAFDQTYGQGAAASIMGPNPEAATPDDTGQ